MVQKEYSLILNIYKLNWAGAQVQAVLAVDKGELQDTVCLGPFYVYMMKP